MKIKIEDIFEVTGTRSLDAGNLVFQDSGINFIGRTNENNGIQGKIAPQEFPPNEAYTITASVIGNYKYAKLQTEEYYTSQNINKLKPKKEYHVNVLRYFVAHIQKFISQYNGQQSGYKLDDIRNHKIEIPIDEDGKLNEEYIIKSIYNYKNNTKYKIKEYLKKEYKLEETIDKNKIIEELKGSEYKEFYLTELFYISNTTNLIRREIKSLNGKFPYVSASKETNGIKEYIDHDKNMLMEGNSIFIGGKTFTVFYQPNDYFSNDSHNLSLILKDAKYRSREIQLYLVSSIYKSLKSKYEWASSVSKEKIIKDKIKLPINSNDQPNYILMEKYIKSLQKSKIDIILKI